MGGSKRFGHLVGSFRRRYQRLFGKGRMLVRTQRLDADRALSEFSRGRAWFQRAAWPWPVTRRRGGAHRRRSARPLALVPLHASVR